jgi:streptogramin lyase
MGGCYSPGLSKFNGSHWTTYTTPSGTVIAAIASDSNGNIWIAETTKCYKGDCIYADVSKFDGSSWTVYTTADGLAGNSVNAITSDSAGNVWFSTNGGVSKFDGTHWTTYSTADGLASNNVNAIANDLSGNVWFATDSGVSKFDGTSWTTYTNADGLVSNSISAIASDRAGNLWFGTGGNGVSELYFIHSLNANYTSGTLGSYFNLTSDHFPANQSVPLSVNDAQLGNIPVSSNGVFTFTLSTANAEQGIYIVTVGELPSVQARLRLDAQQPFRPKEGDYIVIDIPAGIALTPRFYLPIIRR